MDARNTNIDGARIATLLHRRKGMSSGAIREPVDFSGARVTGDVAIAKLRLAADVRLVGAIIDGTLMVDEVTGLKHLRLGAPAAERTRVERVDVTGCKAADDDLVVAELDVRGTLRLHDNALRYLGLDRVSCELLVVSGLGVDELELRDVAWKEHRAVLMRVGGGTTIDGALGETTTLQKCHFESWSEIRAASPLEMYRCAFEGPVQLTWIPPRDIGRVAEGEPRRPVRVDHVVAPGEAATSLVLDSVRFASTAHLRWGSGDVTLDGAIFSAASSLEEAPGARLRPRLRSVRELDGEHLRLADVRVADCNLRPAASIGVIDAGRLHKVPWSRGWTRRRYIRDERTPPAVAHDDDPRTRLEKQRQLEDWNAERAHPTLFAARLAGMYRELRTKAEAAGDHAGANELHYGERLWQRRASRHQWAQYLWLCGYGLVGFGVRPWRPLAWLVALVVAAGLALAATGLERDRVLDGAPGETAKSICERNDPPEAPADQQSVTCPVEGWDAVEFAARSTTGLVRPPTGYTTHDSAAWLELATRLLAALLFALFVLAVRNRVRR